MTRLLLAGVVAVAGLVATPSANAECTLEECCFYTHDGGWCVPVSVNQPICIYTHDGGWCAPEV